MTEQKYIGTYQVIEETTDRNQKEKYWNIGFGLNKIDQLNPSEYLTNELLLIRKLKMPWSIIIRPYRKTIR
jgi:hypothetical protein